MAENITVNINDYVIVTLKEDGKQILLRHHEGIGLPKKYHHKPQEDGTYKFAMWEWMRIFGPHMTIGMQVPFDTNIIVRRNV